MKTFCTALFILILSLQGVKGQTFLKQQDIHEYELEYPDTQKLVLLECVGEKLQSPDGRSFYLKGVNVGGAAKTPVGCPGSEKECLYNGEEISFVGRPIPIDKADHHFVKLRSWGFNAIRLCITWEAIEHEGPGIYDEEYLAYVEQLSRIAGDFGISVWIDPHQDVASRFSGGDGAPRWVFDSLGMDVTKFADCGAAVFDWQFPDGMPHMCWPTNYSKYASATFFTVFFGGNTFAPEVTIDNKPAQEFLQDHYMASIEEIVKRLAGKPYFLGVGTMNEPSEGFIGHSTDSKGASGILQGHMPTVWESIRLAAGFSADVEVWKVGAMGMKKAGTERITPPSGGIWIDGRQPVWMQGGMWKWDPNGSMMLMDEELFLKRNGVKVDFEADFLGPFVENFASRMKRHGEFLIFAEPNIGGVLPAFQAHDNIVNAPHYYDGPVMLKRAAMTWVGVEQRHGNQYKLVLGKRKARKAVDFSVSELQQSGSPTVIGETGIPFNFAKAKDFPGSDYSRQALALDRTLDAMENQKLSYFLWNYNIYNSDEQGDSWNAENFSIYSAGKEFHEAKQYKGGRALEAIIRPYPRLIPGSIEEWEYDYQTALFNIKVQIDPSGPGSTLPIQLYLPELPYAEGFQVNENVGEYYWYRKQRILYYYPADGEEEVEFIVKPDN